MQCIRPYRRACVGADRLHLLKQQRLRGQAGQQLFNAARPPALGCFDDGFTAVYSGISPRRGRWDMSPRIELPWGDRSNKCNCLLAATP